MTVRSFTLASVMVSPGWVFVQERLSSTMPQVFVMIQILFQDGKNLQLRVFFFNAISASLLTIYSENFWKDKEKEELQDYYDYDYS